MGIAPSESFVIIYHDDMRAARRHLGRYFGWYSHKSRGMVAQAHRRHRHAAEIDDQHAPRPHLAPTPPPPRPSPPGGAAPTGVADRSTGVSPVDLVL